MTLATPTQDSSSSSSQSVSLKEHQHDPASWIGKLPTRPSSYGPGTLEHTLTLAYFARPDPSSSPDEARKKRPPSLPPLPFLTASVSPGLVPTLVNPLEKPTKSHHFTRTGRPLSLQHHPPSSSSSSSSFSPHKATILSQPPALVLPQEPQTQKPLSSTILHSPSSSGVDSLRKAAITQSALLHTPPHPHYPEPTHSAPPPPDPSAYLAVFDDEELRRWGDGSYTGSVHSHARSPSATSSNAPFLGLPGSTSAHTAAHFSPVSSSSSLSNASSLVGRASGRPTESWGLHPGAWLFLLGFLIFPMWWIGALLPIRSSASMTPSEKARMRRRYGGEAAARRVARRWRTYNRYMSVFSLLLVIGAVALIIWWLKGEF
ncbi:MAG: hypothetical protein DHS80DRAFT_25781 [Piptocephalis tieghemiana]|nr:MAG: hypothetical protein DHS80DRAFT_25781 [Piptocephalis tieghemiana]